MRGTDTAPMLFWGPGPVPPTGCWHQEVSLCPASHQLPRASAASTKLHQKQWKFAKCLLKKEKRIPLTLPSRHYNSWFHRKRENPNVKPSTRQDLFIFFSLQCIPNLKRMSLYKEKRFLAVIPWDVAKTLGIIHVQFKTAHQSIAPQIQGWSLGPSEGWETSLLLVRKERMSCGMKSRDCRSPIPPKHLAEALTPPSGHKWRCKQKH